MLGVSLRQQNDIEVIDIFNAKRKSCNHRCPDSVYFHTVLLILYLRAIETLICRREMRLIGYTPFGFAQNTIHDFQTDTVCYKKPVPSAIHSASMQAKHCPFIKTGLNVLIIAIFYIATFP